MRTIGLLGGMSWQSSAGYYAGLNEGVAARLGGLHSAACVLVSVDFAEIEHLQAAGDWHTASVRLAAAARAAQAAGAEALVLCTNTMHRVADEIAAAVRVPLLHIADATAQRLTADGRGRVGLLGTRFTMEQDFYRGRLEQRHGLEVLVPGADERAVVHDVIYDELCRGVVREESRAAFVAVVEGLAARGAEAVILGCTEIGLLIDASHTDVPLYDTTAIHVEAAVDWALADHGTASPVGPAAVVRRLYEARARGDLEEVRALLAPDVVWREPPGEADYTGVHRSADAVIDDMLGSAMAVTGGTFRLEVEDVAVHGPLAVAYVRWSATINGEHGAGREVAVYRCVDGRVAEAWFCLDDPDATDAFFTG